MMTEQPYYKLYIYLDPTFVDNDTQAKYVSKINKCQNLVNKYKVIGNDWSFPNEEDNWPHIDAGFDLYTPENNTFQYKALGQKVNMGVKCAMTFNGMPVGYYLYPRSSTGSKTPLRLSNSVGIIDSGYRGHIVALFDNVSNKKEKICNDYSAGIEYVINKNDRVVQICAPNITYPIYPQLVTSEDELGNTLRGIRGFGSSGK